VVDLSKFVDKLSQPRLVTSGGASMYQVIASRFINDRHGGLEFKNGFFPVRLGPNVFDRLAQPGTKSPVASSVGFGCFHALGAGFVIRQLEPFLVINNKSACKYNRRFPLVNQ